MLKHVENQACPHLTDLVGGDPVTYSVLLMILQGPCRDIFTDDGHVVICYSSPPWPIWVWCRPGMEDAFAGEIGACLKAHYPLQQGFDIIMSQEVLQALGRDPYFARARRKMGLISHRLDNILPLEKVCDGGPSLVREEDIPGLVKPWQDHHLEMENRAFTLEECAQQLHRQLANKELYAWKNEQGVITCLTARGDQGNFSKVASVYTLPGYRRKGYAMNLVHKVTRDILADGLIPILYTDADYTASNACYQKIGYRQVGALVSICK